jgi:hypothetical protein
MLKVVGWEDDHLASSHYSQSSVVTYVTHDDIAFDCIITHSYILTQELLDGFSFCVDVMPLEAIWNL